MSASPQVDQSFAVLSVLAERESQVQGKGYIHDHEDGPVCVWGRAVAPV